MYTKDEIYNPVHAKISQLFGDLYKGLDKHTATFDFEDDAQEFFEYLADADGILCRYPVRTGHKCYIVEFKDC